MAAALPSPSGLSSRERLLYAGITLVAAVTVALWALDAPEVLQFVMAGVSVAGLAYVLGDATEQVGESSGARVSALLNATFGNAAEIIIVVLAINAGLIDVARASIVGSVLGNVLLILGFSIVAFGVRHGRASFDPRTVGMNATMLVLAAVALGLPSLFAFTSSSTGAEQGVSHAVAVVMALLYGLYLFASFQHPEEAGTEEAAGHARWSRNLSLTVLALSAIGTGFLSEVLVSAIEPTIEATGISAVFIGLIVIPLVGNVAEHFAAVKIAWGGDIDFAMGISFNSALQVALAVSAIAVLAGALLGHEVTLAFTALELAVLAAGTILAGLIAANGSATWLEGVQLFAIYVLAGIVFWYG